MFIFMLLTAALSADAAFGAERAGFVMRIHVNGEPLPEYHHRGTVYIEAQRGREYTIRLYNPLPYQTGVALAVDGLNTIDAKHSDPWNAAKWVLGPYQTIELKGWQTSNRQARRFFFTGERSSYGAWLGEMDNLGVIEAVFYHEKVAWPSGITGGKPGGDFRTNEDRHRPPELPQSKRGDLTASSEGLSDDYAATGIGRETRHDVRWVDLDLDPATAVTVRIRYEFRPQLIELGIYPGPDEPWHRRERSEGFDRSGPYCPEPR